MKHIGGWDVGMLGEFEAQPDGRFTWVKEQQVRKGTLPTTELGALLKAIVEAGPDIGAEDAGFVHFSWLDGNGIVQKRSYSYPQGESCAKLLKKIEELAVKYGSAWEGIRDLNRAVALAVPAFAAASHSNESYKVTNARLMIGDGRYVWRVTFKPIRLLPHNPSTEEVGAGGEVFVSVDLRTGNTVITYGE